MNMTPELQVALLQLVARVGIDAAVAIMEGIKNATTVDEAIDALKKQLSYKTLTNQ